MRTFRTCLLCGARFDDAKQRLNHEANHPLPPEAKPAVGCEHGPLGIFVAARMAQVAVRGTKDAGVPRQWNRRFLPKIVLKIVEDENGGSIHRIGWYFPRTGKSAHELDDMWHLSRREDER